MINVSLSHSACAIIIYVCVVSPILVSQGILVLLCTCHCVVVEYTQRFVGRWRCVCFRLELNGHKRLRCVCVLGWS